MTYKNDLRRRLKNAYIRIQMQKMRAYNGISGEKRKYRQTYLRTVQKFGPAKAIVKFCRRAQQQFNIAEQRFLPYRHLSSVLERINYENCSNINR
jgi:hypothetical protein